MKPTLWIILALLFLTSACNSTDNEKATIAIRDKTKPKVNIHVYLYKNFDRTILAESTTDSLGNCTIEIPLKNATFASLQIGESNTEVYLSPGYNLSMNDNPSGAAAPYTFTGTGAGINNYITIVNSMVEGIVWKNGQGMVELDSDEFVNRFASLKDTVTTFHKHYTDTVVLDKNSLSILNTKNRLKFLTLQEEHNFIQGFRLNKKSKVLNPQQNFSDDEKLIDSALVMGDAEYYKYLALFWQNKINLPITYNSTDTTQEVHKPAMMDSLIKSKTNSSKLRESLTAYNIQNWLNTLGIIPETEAIFANFKNAYKQSAYLPALNKAYNEFLELAPGKPAPEFEGLTIEGKKVSLKDLRGKLIYIDVWATWCRPCIAEIPASIELQKKYGKEEGIRFLNVSIDRDVSAWKNFLKEHKNWKGLHINVEPAQVDSLYSSYKLFGIPAYILIDQHGKIVKLKSPRPSDEKALKMIEEIISNYKSL